MWRQTGRWIQRLTTGMGDETRAPADIRTRTVYYPESRDVRRQDHLASATWHVAADAPQAAEPFAAGARIADLYQVVRLIGSDHAGSTYLVRNRHHVELALRVAPPELAGDRGAARKMMARAEQWIALGVHRNITACYAVHLSTGRPLIAMERVDGVPLSVWSAEHRGDVRVNLQLALQMCRGLEHAHGRGVVHGSLTPAAGCVTGSGVVKLQDFGVPLSGGRTGAAFAAPAASSGPHAETAYALTNLRRDAPYVAPERWHEPSAASAAADIFALGVCLWEVFSGIRPYESTAADSAPALPELTLSEDHGGGLAALLRGCVAWEASNRPPDIEAVRTELLRIHQRYFADDRGFEPAEPSEADRANAAAVHAFAGGRVEEADQGWATALALHGGHVPATLNRHVALWRQGGVTDEALLAELEALALTQSQRGALRTAIALVHLDRGDLDAAETHLQQARDAGADLTEITAALERVRRRRAIIDPVGLDIMCGGGVSAVAITVDGKAALIASEHGPAVVWDVTTGICVQPLSGQDAVSAAVLSADGQAAITGAADGMIRAWNVPTGRCEGVLATATGPVTSLAITADGNLMLWLARSSHEIAAGGTPQVKDNVSGRVRSLDASSAAVRCAVLSPEGRYAVAGADDHRVYVWDLNGGRWRIIAGHEHVVSGVCVSTDGGLILSGSWDATLRLWERRSCRCIRVFRGHTASVTAVSLSTDATWAASGDLDGTVRLWEMATGRCVRTLHAHRTAVHAVAISGRGERVVSGSLDGTVRAWNTSLALREPCCLRVGDV